MVDFVTWFGHVRRPKCLVLWLVRNDMHVVEMELSQKICECPLWDFVAVIEDEFRAGGSAEVCW